MGFFNRIGAGIGYGLGISIGVAIWNLIRFLILTGVFSAGLYALFRWNWLSFMGVDKADFLVAIHYVRQFIRF